MKKTILTERFQQLAGIKPLIKENEGKDAMEAFLKATEEAPNQDEILEKFEKVMDSIFGKGIMQKDVSHLIDKAEKREF